MKRKEEEELKQNNTQEEVLGQLLRLAGSRPPVPGQVALRVKSAVHAHWRKSVRGRSFRRHFFLGIGTVAAGILFYLVSVHLLSREIGPPLPVGIVENLTGDVLSVRDNGEKRSAQLLKRGEILVGQSWLESGESGRILLRLIGRGSLRMDVNTRLRLESESSFALDHGTVYIDSGPRGASLALATPMGTIRNHGTQFEVRLNQETMRVRVREGSVLLVQNGLHQTATAGTELALNKKGVAVFTKVSRYGAHWSWVSEIAPTFHLEGRSLMEFLEWVTRENGWNIKFVEPEIRKATSTIILHGSVAGLRPDQMPSAVLPVSDLSYSVSDGVLTIKRDSVIQR